ncbi:MAG: hypothetical protein WD824_14165 [Cyclobacteriaceae bacterium]
MKNSIFGLLAGSILCLTFSAHATIRTVSNNPDRPAQFATVQSAIDASVAGDTIYVHGSQFLYPDFTVNKRLVIMGAGYNSNNQFNLPTRVSNIYFFRDAGLQDGSGSVISGFAIASLIYFQSGSLSINDIRLFRNSLSTIYTYLGANYGNNWTIYNNIISGSIYGGSGGPTAVSATNISIQNNIFSAGIIYGFSASSVLIDHNVFTGANNLNYLYYATLTNNIFIRSTGTLMTAQVNFNTFNKNISNLTTVGPTAPTNSFTGGSNSEGTNYVAVTPDFEVVTDLNNYNNTFNYRLKASSVGRNNGTDGTDIGIYGGAFPFPSGGAIGSGFDTSPLPPIPQVTEVNIQNATLQPGTPLNVQVKARVNNYT